MKIPPYFWKEEWKMKYNVVMHNNRTDNKIEFMVEAENLCDAFISVALSLQNPNEVDFVDAFRILE